MKIFFVALLAALFIKQLVELQEDKALQNYFWVNVIFQLAQFTLISCLPFLKNNFMSNVDISWPWGLFFMGIFSLYFGTTSLTRKILISTCYLIQGFRMGGGGTRRILKMKQDFPRYQYVEEILAKKGHRELFKKIYKLCDIMAQGLGNIGLMGAPIMINSFVKDETTYTIEYIFFALFFFCIFMETKADLQKKKFIFKNLKKEGGKFLVCQEGLWRYCRHPNYFFEALIWVIYACWTLFNLNNQFKLDKIHFCVFYSWASMLALLVILIYYFLLQHTGAKPAEYYSLQKRPGYKLYTQTTNQFIPWFPKKLVDDNKQQS